MMAYRTPQQFGKMKLPPGLGDIKMGDSVDDPIPMEEEFEMEPEPLPGEFGNTPPRVPNPKPIGAAKVAQYKQLGAAGGAKVSNFFQHPFTHLSVGVLAGLVLADIMPDKYVMGALKHPAASMTLTGLGTMGVLSVVYR